MEKGRLYLTTPIYYANDRPHIGHAYTTILADVINRFHALLGYETFFLTGTDEHGQKVDQAARARGISPKEHVDEYHQRFKEMWKLLGIHYDRFIRTTDSDHIEHVQKALQFIYDKGEIYSKDYEGWYSVGEERFFSEDELVDGKDPISGRPVEWLQEKNYFFKMSAYQERLIAHIEENKDFILPEFRRNEVLGFLRQPLQDLCISRPKSRLSWGIPLPFDKDYVAYVWFDALLNYCSGVEGRHFSNGSPLWPADFHILGKDILTTHCVYWPSMLMALERPLPRHFLAHGWWLLRDSKMSKSAGNVVSPLDLVDRHGPDAVRYFLMREMVVGQDASFSEELFRGRINTELANDLGNAVHRVNKLVQTHFAGILPEMQILEAPEKELIRLSEEVCETARKELKEIRISFALEAVMSLVRSTNRYLDKRAPWTIAKELKGLRSESSGDENEASSRKQQIRIQEELLGSVLYAAAETLRLALTLLSAVMPGASKKGLAMLGMHGELKPDQLEWGFLEGGEELQKGEVLFPRIEAEDTEKSKNSTEPRSESKSKENKKISQNNKKNQEVDPAAKLALLVCKIEAVEDHPEADSLYVLRLDLGGLADSSSKNGESSSQPKPNEARVVCAGLKKHYLPEELRGKRAVLFANLKPARLRGIESHGMLLASTVSEDTVRLIDPGEIPVGSLLSFEGIEPQPKKKAGLKDYEKLHLHVKSGRVAYKDRFLGEFASGTEARFVSAEGKDGAAVK